MRDVSETIYDFQDLIQDINEIKSLRTNLNRRERNALKEINIALQRYLGPVNSIHVVGDFLDGFDNRSKLIKKLKDEDLSELISIGNKLSALKLIPSEKVNAER